jgi:hypothetical protein
MLVYGSHLSDFTGVYLDLVRYKETMGPPSQEREREREMGRRPCCSKEGLNRGAWTALEDKILAAYIKAHGEGKWRNLPKRAGTYIYTSIFKQNFAAAFFLFQIFSFS